MDILSDNECINTNTSNVLGYYYDYNEGFKYKDNSYTEDQRKEKCQWPHEKDCIK